MLGGVSIVVFGLIAVTGARIWVVNKVDFSDNRNLIVAAVTLVLGAGDFSLKIGGFSLGGIGTATFGAIILYAILRKEKEPPGGLSVRRAASCRPRHLCVDRRRATRRRSTASAATRRTARRADRPPARGAIHQ